MALDRSIFIDKNHQEFLKYLESITWISPEKAGRSEGERESLLNKILGEPCSAAGWMFGRTKLFTHGISPGCRLCGLGKWSCLFINNLCNARCFYCPDRQDEASVPVTNNLEFGSPQDYADYINTCDIRGVSFSGGEPLMTYDRILRYLKILRKSVTHPLHIWMYTNGILVTPNILRELRDLGLDEIRFDISADHYCLEKVKMAVDVIPTVTVEIPAVPEDFEMMKHLVKDLADIRVNYLNLHQIRCTLHNVPKLVRRGYTFLHGPRVTILETELTALSLIRYALEAAIPLPINYCSFTYRHQYQGAGARKRGSVLMKAGHEDITPTGFIRSLALIGPKDKLDSVHRRLVDQGHLPGTWKYDSTGGRLMFAQSLWPFINKSGFSMVVSYSNTSLKGGISYRHPFREIRLNSKKKIVVEKKTEIKDLPINHNLRSAFDLLFGNGGKEVSDLAAIDPLAVTALEPVIEWEWVREGLAPYY